MRKRAGEREERLVGTREYTTGRITRTLKILQMNERKVERGGEEKRGEGKRGEEVESTGEERRGR